MSSRRGFLGQAAVSVFGAALPVASSRAQSRFARFQGQTVTFSIPEHAHYDAMLKLLPEFTAQTGIKVEAVREHMLRMKFQQMAEMAKPQGRFDLVCYVVMWKGEYVAKGLIQELAPFLHNPQLADPAFDLADIVPGYLQNLGLVGGPKGYLAGPGAKLYGLPYGAETSILAYRRDLFAQANLQPPKTYTELRQLLHMLKDKTGLPALASRGQAGHQCVHAWLLHLNPLGGKVFDQHWRPSFQQPEGVAALELLREIAYTGPAGIPEAGQAEMMKAFLQGQSAMYLDSTIVFGPVRDAAQSRIDGKVSYVLHPKGVHYSSQSGGLGLALPRNATNPEAAFLLMQWLTAKAQDKAVCRLGGGPTRWSTMADADLVRQYPEYITLKEQLRYADPDWRPIIPPWDDINTGPLGAAVFQGLTGQKPPAQALAAIVPRVNEIMQRAGYLKEKQGSA
jgi:multiple sugar transport system substrate-binding protein